MSLLARANAMLYRFKSGVVGSWAERAKQEQDALAELRLHSGFSQLLDVLDGEERALFRKWRASATDQEALDLHKEARAFSRIVRLLDDTTKARDHAAEIERQMQLMAVDRERETDALARQRNMMQSMQNGLAARS